MLDHNKNSTISLLNQRRKSSPDCLFTFKASSASNSLLQVTYQLLYNDLFGYVNASQHHPDFILYNHRKIRLQKIKNPPIVIG
jgi:hypothetical protein